MDDSYNKNKNSNNISRAFLSLFFKDRNGRNCFLLFSLLLLFKVFWFDYSWCSISTFRPFSYAETYVFGFLLSAVLMLPLLFRRTAWIMWVLSVALGVLCICNLIYFRTYYTAIPLSSYGLVGNMKDFTSSIYGSFRWTDVMFPVSTFVAALFSFRLKNSFRGVKLPLRYLLFVLALAVVGNVLVFVKGGFKKAYESLQDSYTHTCGTPMYTIFGSMYYDYVRGKDVYTPEVAEEIKLWLSKQDAMPPFAGNAACKNCILILAESLESWVLEQTVEGQEIMPYLNSLIKDTTTIYAPHVLSQVKGGRSIDAQLMFNCGLLPIDNGVYSLKYPHTFYPSLVKAMKEKYASDAVRAYTLTADKPMVWNQCVIEPAFGYDSLLSKHDFVNDEPVGPHYRPQLGDGSLMRQIIGKIRNGDIWNDNTSIFLQCVTYSGHFPFVLPEHLRNLSFSNQIPSRMQDYMQTANYTDRALGWFVEQLRAMGEFENTLIVIVGDHEGLADMRRDLCASVAGHGVVSDKPFTPLIILNAPVGMHYEKVMGQIDVYPTILQLLGLNGYLWEGLGRSILDPLKPGVAVDAHGKVYGDATDVSEDEIRHLKDAWKISDAIIRYDYFSISDSAKLI